MSTNGQRVLFSAQKTSDKPNDLTPTVTAKWHNNNNGY